MIQAAEYSHKYMTQDVAGLSTVRVYGSQYFHPLSHHTHLVQLSRFMISSIYSKPMLQG